MHLPILAESPLKMFSQTYQFDDHIRQYIVSLRIEPKVLKMKEMKCLKKCDFYSEILLFDKLMKH